MSDSVRDSSRRGFLGRLWLVLGGVALAEAVWIVVAFFKPRPSVASSGNDTIFVAGPVERFEPGTVTAFPGGRFYLARLADGGFLALNRECTHLGCTVPWVEAEERFVCPCHASSFDITGQVLGPPAPRPLDYFPVRIENRVVKVDLGAPIRRRSFADAQVARS
ncbi:MAG TPA: ubiquinol-cytochrome c reductase iron-sulfur subunit [Chondromyces sp.]|nr:ubiquinol-cytochrome c reductase iron-sulfur subunit [Chondromyces sp.]